MAYDYRFVNDEIRGLLVGKKKMCLEGLCVKELSASVNCITKDPLRAYQCTNSARGKNDVGWSDIMTAIWHSGTNCPLEMVNGEVVSLNGLFGSCFGIEPSIKRRDTTVGRMCNQLDFHQRIGGAYVE